MQCTLLWNSHRVRFSHFYTKILNNMQVRYPKVKSLHGAIRIVWIINLYYDCYPHRTTKIRSATRFISPASACNARRINYYTYMARISTLFYFRWTNEAFVAICATGNNNHPTGVKYHSAVLWKSCRRAVSRPEDGSVRAITDTHGFVGRVDRGRAKQIQREGENEIVELKETRKRRGMRDEERN